jgi:hypothetical protein
MNTQGSILFPFETTEVGKRHQFRKRPDIACILDEVSTSHTPHGLLPDVGASDVFSPLPPAEVLESAEV